MIDAGDPQRDRIQEVLQEVGPISTPDRAAVLTGWAVVTEWMDESGEKWIAKTSSDSITSWQAGGLYHEALYGDWPGEEEDE